MPVHPSVPSLKIISIQTIGVHFNRICYGVKTQEQMNELIESEEYLKRPSPFKLLSGKLLEELYENICRKRCSSYHLNILIQSQIRSFKVQSGTIHYAIVYLQQRCPMLENFELTSSIDVIPEFFINVFSYFPNLVKLNLSGNVIDDRSFETIGIHCKKLEHLNVSGSTIQDSGLKYLCKSPQNIPRCKKLNHINLLKTRISKETVGRFLYFHPMLSELLYEDVIGALAEVEKIAFENNSNTQFVVMGISDIEEYKVKGLTCHEKRDINIDMVKALRLNPELEELKIIDSTLSNQRLSSLDLSQQLQTLEIVNNDSFTIEFEASIVPILSICGKRLKKLVLEKFRFIDLDYVGRQCKSLTVLGLSHILQYGKIKNLNRDSFSNLEELDFMNEYGARIFHNIIKQLLFNSSNIQYLHLQRIECLDDILLTQVINKNNLSSLVSLTLDQCHTVSGEWVSELVKQPNNLQILNIWSCKFITSVHKDIMKKTISTRNFDMCFRCLPYMGFVAPPLPPTGLIIDSR